MQRKSLQVNDVLETISQLDIENQSFISEILSKRLIEYQRLALAQRAEQADRNYRNGKTKKGTVQDLWKDLND
ncbi:MAG: hypothetical protein KGZ58_07270 [Ignavibacteriales bacterium]|nr:hypothetical protein [Ignavibacteriales bacterium]